MAGCPNIRMAGPAEAARPTLLPQLSHGGLTQLLALRVAEATLHRLIAASSSRQAVPQLRHASAQIRQCSCICA